MDKVNASNDKQKVLVLGALVVVMVGVGAFSFMGGGGAPKPKDSKPKEVAAQADVNATDPAAENTTQPGKEATGNQLFAQRDPFAPNGEEAATTNPTVPVNPGNIAPPVAPAPAAAPTTPRVPRPVGIQPMDPMTGDVQPLPNVTNGSGNASNPGQITGISASNNGSAPSYRLTGVITGDKPMAVVEGPSGKQQIVKVGDKINGQTVTAIKNGKLVLEDKGAKGQPTTLRIKEDASKQ